MPMETIDESLAGMQLWRMTKLQYQQLWEKGFFRPEERVELVFGMVVEMPPSSPEHDESTSRVQQFLTMKLAARAKVRCQSTFDATGDSMPEPDVFVIPNGDYWHSHPTRANLVVEVSRSSARYDRITKRKLYALAEVDEYWIVDHNTGTVVVHRDRRAGGWDTMRTFTRGQRIAMLAFPDVEIDVAEILPPTGV